VEKQLAYAVISTASKQHRDVRREKETRNNKTLLSAFSGPPYISARCKDGALASLSQVIAKSAAAGIPVSAGQ